MATANISRGNPALPDDAKPGTIGVHAMPGEEDELTAFGRKQGHGDFGRMPVAVLAPAPPRRPLPGGNSARRPVIALPDTGVEHHPWLDGPPDDPVVLHAEDRGWQPPDFAPAANPWRGSVFRGHATFGAGMIRQAGPDCRILSARVMSDDGIVAAADALRVLDWLATEVESGEQDRFVDVVCLAFGYTLSRGVHAQTDPDTAELRAVLGRLAAAGVLIVASAGNSGDDVPTYPAAFAGETASSPRLSRAVISVAATNPDGTYALYSNWGSPWVTHQAIGSGVISLMPSSFNGPLQPPPPPGPPYNFPQSKGVTIDPDNFSDGFARWSGTSFSASTIAGLLGQALAGDGTAAPSEERVFRALAAIRSYQYET